MILLKFLKRLILLIFLLLLLAGASAVLFVYIPYRNAQSAMSADREMQLETMDDGKLKLTWPEATGMDYYTVELAFPPVMDEEPVLAYQTFVKDGNSLVLPRLPENQDLLLRVNTIVEYKTPGEVRMRSGEHPLQVLTNFRIPRIENLTWHPEPDGKKIVMDYELTYGDSCRIFCTAPDGTETLLATTKETHQEFAFGETEGLPMPEYGQTVSFRLEAFRSIPGLNFEGTGTESFEVCREDLLGRDLTLELTDNGDNVVTLNWNETKGEYYEVQQQDTAVGGWTVLARVGQQGPYTCTTAHLPACHDYLYRVVAVGGQVMENSQIAALSEEKPFSSSVSTTYCTIWPVSNLNAYSDPEKNETVGKVQTAAAYCVLGEKDGMFAIRLDGKTCYIDSSYCMINLPEYLGPLCAYNITNSYNSLYMVHEYGIPNVTGVVTGGYDHVRMADGTYLVPLLYPTAQKLRVAAETARDQGYRLKIYDAYRPNKATKEIYNLTNKILQDTLPDRSYTGRYTAPKETTYKQLMTNGTWSLGSFLAAGGSLHNLGIAVDLTLEDRNTHAELAMQTSMHDLSWYSVLSRNNGNANTLASIMKSAGLNELVSEWWHFQDNEARANLVLPTVYDGVSPECWMNDGFGWKYRRYNGTYFADCQREIGGVSYTFNENGYVLQQAEEAAAD